MLPESLPRCRWYPERVKTPSEARETGTAVTARSVCLGLLCVTALGLVNGYNDYLQNTLLTAHSFPMAAVATLSFLVFGVNAVSRRFLGLRGLSGGEMLTVFGMTAAGGSVASCGMMRYFPPWAVMPAYYAQTSHEFRLNLLPHIPSCLLVSNDPASDAVRWFMEGLPRGRRIPWAAWIAPTACWGAFALCAFASMFGICSLFFREWAYRERLLFPLVQLPVEMAREPGNGRVLNDFLRNRVLWAGALLAGGIHFVNGLGTFVPGLPAIPLAFDTFGLFPDRPWSEFNLGSVRVFFLVAGLTFLLPVDLSFSLWFFFVLYKLTYVLIAWMGAGGSGFWGDWYAAATVFQAGGAILALCAMLVWQGRDHLKTVLLLAVRGKEEKNPGLLGPRLTVLLCAGGLAGMAAWMMILGADSWAAVFVTILFAAVVLALARLVAETGFLLVASGVFPHDVLAGLVPAGWISAPTLAVTTMLKGVFMQEYREVLLPYLMNGLKACDAFRLKPRHVLAAFALAVLTGVLSSGYGRISASYKYGGINMDLYANIVAPQSFLGSAATMRTQPPSYDWVTVGGKRVIPVKAAHFTFGAALMGALIFMRDRFVWWPLCPIALIPTTIWIMQWGGLWFSIFLGWLAKAVVMRFGGAVAYRRILPFFLGLALGEFLLSAFWTAVGLLTGFPPPSVLP